MPAPHEKTIRAFYSWQTDLPDAVNLSLIRKALNDAASNITGDASQDVVVVVDEATREVPGSPNIADSIFSKIREADVFVCDLTKSAELKNDAGVIRKYHNSNVAIELGYAVRVLGWNRIIIIFNEGYGSVSDDLPFDARNHRASTYKCKAELDEKGKPTSACQSLISNATGLLRGTLMTALTSIIKNKPKRPSELEQPRPEDIRRQRDLIQLQAIFRWINVKLLDRFINALAESRVLYEGEFMLQEVSRVLSAPSFHLSDGELLRLLEVFVDDWRNSFNHSFNMDPHPNGKGGYFKLPGDCFVSKEQEEEFNYTYKQAQPLRSSLDALLGYIREHYLEIDLSQIGAEEVQAYWQREKEMKSKLEAP